MDFSEAKRKALVFREERDWEQFHNPKDLAISISLEAAELLEVFQWSGSETGVRDKRQEAVDELADIMIYCIYMAEELGVAVSEVISDKIDCNREKYPADKARGNSRKYTEL